MKIPHVAHQTRLTLAVLAALCSSRSEGVVSDCTPASASARTVAEKFPQRKKKGKCFTACLSLGRYSDGLNCVTRRLQTSVRQLFGASFLLRCTKPPENLCKYFFERLPLEWKKRKVSAEQNHSVIRKRGTYKRPPFFLFFCQEVSLKTPFQKWFQRHQNVFVDIASLMDNQWGGKGITPIPDGFHWAANRP